MKTLQIRALSAIAAIAFMFAGFYFFEIQGLRFICLLVVILGSREIVRILFSQTQTTSLKVIFALIAITLFCFGVGWFELVAPAYGVAVVLFFSISFFYHHRFPDLELLSRFQARAILGFFYIALLPTFACKLLDFQDGLLWFLSLLAIVFAGDTFAYLVGWAFGKHLLMPQVSPKKTIEGSIGGLLGSCLAAGLFHVKIPHIPLPALIALGFAVGLVGQMGDLFESMLKRVANQKDSGSLMPGHGGVLDRIDGVLFAAPMMFAGVSLLEILF
ncbi:MAG: phosphatidate cytidylyltransferase [Bdellovibrio sp.]|jgi:phosphatidate cytidylyltransferase